MPETFVMLVKNMREAQKEFGRTPLDYDTHVKKQKELRVLEEIVDQAIVDYEYPFTCPVCDKPDDSPARDWHICGTCWTEFAGDGDCDAMSGLPIAEVRERWKRGEWRVGPGRKEGAD
jgi:hypothetical protein